MSVGHCSNAALVIEGAQVAENDQELPPTGARFRTSKPSTFEPLPSVAACEKHRWRIDSNLL
jgi:hypothetical protein